MMTDRLATYLKEWKSHEFDDSYRVSLQTACREDR